MNEHHIDITRRARYFTLGDAARGVAEVWFVCHGYGQLAARFLEKFRVLADGRRYLVAPEGLSRFYLTEDPAERRVGASWMTREDRLAEIDDYVRYLDAVYADVFGSVDRSGRSRVTVVALGFSQGAATVSRWAAMGVARIDRLVLWGGELPPDPDLSVAADRLRAVKLSLVYGRHDEFFTPKVIAETEARLHEHRVAYDVTAFDGGHELDEALLRRLAAAWVTDDAAPD
jgi:predicted esterase